MTRRAGLDPPGCRVSPATKGLFQVVVAQSPRDHLAAGDDDDSCADRSNAGAIPLVGTHERLDAAARAEPCFYR